MIAPEGVLDDLAQSQTLLLGKTGKCQLLLRTCHGDRDSYGLVYETDSETEFTMSEMKDTCMDVQINQITLRHSVRPCP